MLKPQDILVLLRLVGESSEWSFQQLSNDLGMSASEVHQALKRAETSGLFDPRTRKVMKRALLEFARYGLQYVFPAKRLPRAYGMPTAHSAPPLQEVLVADSDDCLVWPHPAGDRFGDAIEPLYRSAPGAAARNPKLYRRLALIDAIRAGRLREKEVASRLLEEEFGG